MENHMTTRITPTMIKARISLLNGMFGLDNDVYLGSDDSGNLIPNVGVCYLDKNDGGYRIERITQGGGATDVSPRGKTREVYDYINGMIDGAYMMGKMMEEKLGD